MTARLLFGGRAQVAVGVALVAATFAQGAWWGFVRQPTVSALFWLSIEALLFAAFAMIAAALGFRATERVEAAVIEHADNVDVEVS